MGGSSCKECLFINESFIIFYFCIDFIESQCYNLQEIKKKKTLMRRVLCGKLPERDTFAESILSRQTKEDHLGVAVNQPADTVNRRSSDLFLEFMIKGYETDNQGGTAITRPMDFY